ncbi:hypothetical protein Taro_036621 [Colocasia esculenta]|uniref:Protein FAR1-RELATED SEQUENCE n=1 Tax=Colocasia esculenta TaxID=4460 RepID=A0A843W7B4_COLES|nr:hypothetical protein [Colocasia esculenta]
MGNYGPTFYRITKSDIDAHTDPSARDPALRSGPSSGETDLLGFLLTERGAQRPTPTAPALPTIAARALPPSLPPRSASASISASASPGKKRSCYGWEIMHGSSIKLGSDDKFWISDCNTTHNHELATPHYVHMLRSQRPRSSPLAAKLLENKRNQELEANFRMTQSQPYVPPVSMIKHAARVYTSSVFYMFMAEYVIGLECLVKDEQSDGATQILTVEDGRHHHYVVRINIKEEALSCSCQKFEFMGILCGHVLACITNDLRSVPDRYILRRWTRSASSPCDTSTTHSDTLGEVHQHIHSQRYNLLIRDFVPLFVKAAEDEDLYNYALNHKLAMNEEMERISKDKASSAPISISGIIYDETGTRNNGNEIGSQSGEQPIWVV